jgi:hypothetical protein
MAFLKLIGFGFVALTIIYWSIAIYARSVRKERLEDEFDADHNGDRAARDAFVAEGMRAYHASMRPKLILLVYIIPVVAVGSIVYFINMN